MARSKVTLPEADLAPLRAQLFEWRANRTPRSPIPAELWAAAAALARIHGTCPVARALGLDYAALKARQARSAGSAAESAGLVRPAFVEVSAARGFAPSTGTSIEITAADGSRMSIQLETGQGRDAAGIVAAFLGSRG